MRTGTCSRQKAVDVHHPQAARRVGPDPIGRVMCVGKRGTHNASQTALPKSRWSNHDERDFAEHAQCLEKRHLVLPPVNLQLGGLQVVQTHEVLEWQEAGVTPELDKRVGPPPAL